MNLSHGPGITRNDFARRTKLVIYYTAFSRLPNFKKALGTRMHYVHVVLYNIPYITAYIKYQDLGKTSPVVTIISLSIPGGTVMKVKSKMVVLKGVPRILSPQLLYTMARMGHGDQLVLADANFPSSSVCASGPEEIRADGHGIPELLEAILKFFPLDTYVSEPALLMEVTPSDVQKGMKSPSIWDDYKSIINEAEGREITTGTIERFAFYERAKKSFAVVATGETALYGNIILVKGALPPE